MARGRFISNTLGRSDKFSKLPTDEDRLLYTLVLTHADSEGRIEVSPMHIRADCMPWSDATRDWIKASFAAMHDVGLVTLFEAEGKVYAEFTDFHKHNYISRWKKGEKKGLPDREAPSRIPDPNGEHPGWCDDRAVTHEQVMSSSAPPAEAAESPLEMVDLGSHGDHQGEDEESSSSTAYEATHEQVMTNRAVTHANTSKAGRPNGSLHSGGSGPGALRARPSDAELGIDKLPPPLADEIRERKIKRWHYLRTPIPTDEEMGIERLPEAAKEWKRDLARDAVLRGEQPRTVRDPPS